MSQARASFKKLQGNVVLFGSAIARMTTNRIRVRSIGSRRYTSTDSKAIGDGASSFFFSFVTQ